MNRKKIILMRTVSEQFLGIGNFIELADRQIPDLIFLTKQIMTERNLSYLRRRAQANSRRASKLRAEQAPYRKRKQPRAERATTSTTTQQWKSLYLAFTSGLGSEEMARGVQPQRPLFPDSHQSVHIQPSKSFYIRFRYMMMSLIYLYYSAATMLAYVVA